MATPTEAEVQTQISNVVALFVAMRNFGYVNTPNVLDLEDTIAQSMEGDYAPEVLAGVRNIRAGYGSLIARVRDVLDPLWQTYGKVRGFPETTPIEILGRLYTDFIDNSKDVNSREFTFGSPAAGGSNVGDGLLRRLNVDENNLEIENQTPEVRTVKCIADKTSGANEHEEAFEIRGAHQERDRIQITGSAPPGTLNAVSARNSARYLTNPSFTSDPDSLTDPTEISGWTPGAAIGNFAIVEGTANTYRGFQGEGDTPRALKIEADDYIFQTLAGRRFRNPTLGGILVPMYLQIAWNREIGASDALTLTVQLGDQTNAIAVGGAETGWQIGELTIGQKNHFRTWNVQDPEVRITVAGLASGYLLVDDVILAPYQYYDGGWYLPVGGETSFLLDDLWTVTDSIATDSKIQRAIVELYGVYLPHVDDTTETWADPA